MSAHTYRHHVPAELDETRSHTTLVCLPPATTHEPDLLEARIAARIARHTAGVPGSVCPNHFTASPRLTARELALLINPHPARVGLLRCVGGPIGLLDTTFAALTEDVAADLHSDWEQAVHGTPPAAPWRAFLDLADTDNPDSRDAAVEDFFAQPRIAAITHHMGAGAVLTDLREYGAALEAHQHSPAAYTAHLKATVQYGDALITERGQLLTPGPVPRPPIDHTLAERSAYFVAAWSHLSGLDPNTVVVAAECQL